MAKFHVALVEVPFSNVASPPVYDFTPISEEIIDTTVNSGAGTIFPQRDNLYWVVTPIDGNGWVSLGNFSASAPPAATPASQKGWPVFQGIERAWKAPKRKRLGIFAF
ncbi:hypothetical protein CC53_gp169 [Rhizobium phage vB_RleS_L338C]|uniref:hypothetical protein n=1 Tax=Rhizobium phage vB_RleS_L338C TaxID=1414737 RepID=UPI0003D88137|nr:hypothetical protein CC53_gp169 [Rhizobium phage vB_RleS_L338C]AHC30586.1 hypothetical protein L338C_169 [Rhizobium phage vB_RleS_L338C]QNH72139.1 hypothetical protein P11VFA_149 [Rhizobium phage P11VFA]